MHKIQRITLKIAQREPHKKTGGKYSDFKYDLKFRFRTSIHYIYTLTFTERKQSIRFLAVD